jgi:ketosteroid isomerase-like protein
MSATPALGRWDRTAVRLLSRSSGSIRAWLRLLVAMPPSRLRTRLWRQALRVGYATSDAEDWTFLRAYVHPDVVIDLSQAGAWGLDVEREYRGPDGYIRWFETFTETWSEWDTELLEVYAPRGNSVVTVARARGRGAGSGVEVGADLVIAFTYEDGRLRKIKQFPDVDQALAALGVRRRGTADLP